MTNFEYMTDLMERHWHSDTMRSLSQLENQRLVDMTNHASALSDEEREAYFKTEFYGEAT